jgi:NADP-dependent 3-hydroxy acid dehydrogenase YdfG
MNTPTVLITGALTGIGRATADIGFVSRGLYTRCYQDTVENIRRWLDGQAIGG